MVDVLYTDDSILGGPDLAEIEKAIEDIRRAKLNITVEGDIQDFLGINIDRKPDGTIELTQPHLIHQILKDLGMGEETKTKDTPARSSVILSRHSDSPDFDNSFNMVRLSVFALRLVGIWDKLCQSRRIDDDNRLHTPASEKSGGVGDEIFGNDCSNF